MKKRKIIIICFIVVIVVIAIIKNVGLINSTFSIGELKIPIPSLSRVTNIDKTSKEITLKSFKSKSYLEKYPSRFEFERCNYDATYYDKESNITIKNFKVTRGLLFNEVVFSYEEGKKDIIECEKITDPTRLMYYTEENLMNKDEFKAYHKYLDRDGNLFDIYEHSNFFIKVKSGRGRYTFMESHISSGYLSIPTFIDFLDYQVSKDGATKEELENKGNLYKIDGFQFLACNTEKGNKDVYILREKDKVQDNYCE